MKSVTAKCPAKLFLLGEYVVLFGGPALLMAVDKYVLATLSPSDDDTYRIHSTGPGMTTLEGRWQGSGIAWNDAQPAHDLIISLCQALIGVRAINSVTPPFVAHIDSTQLYSQGNKLGLGSSAALCNGFVVAASEYLRHFGRPESAQSIPSVLTPEFIFNAHRNFQHGRGSGADIAAGIYGGVIRFQRASDHLLPDIQPVTLPENLHIGYISIGKPASTIEALTQMHAFQASHPGQFTQALTPLLALACDGVEAVLNNNAREFAAIGHRYCHNLSDFGRTIGVDIVSDAHQELHDLAGAHHIAYKPSGAGSGDFGLAFSTNINRLRNYEIAVKKAGFTPTTLSAGHRCQVV